MLDLLCGSKSMERILLFLFVNGKCYGTQLHRLLNCPLTPIQKALARLEKGGVITSYYEGKTRLYRFNPAYPLLTELELLLKKSYTLLAAAQKREYYFVNEEGTTVGDRMQTLLAFWEKLSAVSSLTFQARSKEGTGWNGTGQGEVMITKEGGNRLIFHEKGVWKGRQAGDVGFSNVFRWSLDRLAGMISLEHLRRGLDSPVFLFHLAPSGKHALSSVDSHLCGGDSYFGRILFDRCGLRLHWRVIGEKKNEEIETYYG